MNTKMKIEEFRANFSYLNPGFVEMIIARAQQWVETEEVLSLLAGSVDNLADAFEGHTGEEDTFIMSSMESLADDLGMFGFTIKGC